jgi:hypothetical protein
MSRLVWQPARGPRAIVLALAAALGLLPASAGAASKAVVAALGDPAPGGGLFAGPGFTGWPAAAGVGWIAFRGQIAAAATSEQLVVAHMAPPVARVAVASIGESAPGGGTFKQFLGRPAINARGDVAFLAVLTPTDASGASDPAAPTPAGIFRYRGGSLTPVALAGQQTPDGELDLLGVLDPLADPSVPDVLERSPAINEAGDVAFVAAFGRNAPVGGALFLAPASGGLTALVRTGDLFDSGQLVAFGPPALNAARTLAFHATATTPDPADRDGMLDGIFTLGAAGLVLAVRDGTQRPLPLDQPLTRFEDPVALNEQGDLAFLAGPLLDPSDDADAAGEGEPGVLVCRRGVLHLIGYPGQRIGTDRVTGVRLGPAGGAALAPPALGGDGGVTFFVALNGGSAEAIVRWTDGDGVEPVVHTAGPAASVSPAGGTYSASVSAPALDGAGAVVFFARIANGATSEAVVYRPPGGVTLGIVVGDPAPNLGFFAGQPFSGPLVNDRGDVVFHAFIARGPSTSALFRARDGRIEPLVRSGDPSPTPGGPPFLEFIGQPSLNAAGSVAFTAQVAGRGRGIYLVDAGGVRPIAVRGDPAPSEPGTAFSFAGLAPNPDIDDAGAVAFRGTVAYRAPGTSATTRREGIFLADAAGLHVLAYEGAPSPEPLARPFFRLQDPVLTGASGVAFRAPLGASGEVTSGLFLADRAGATSPIALEDQELGGGVLLVGFTGRPAVGAGTDIAFLASRARQAALGGSLRPLGPAILRATAAGLRLVVARDMPGPAGGTFRTLGAPSMNRAGHVVFRGSFLPLTGGTAGLFLATDAGVAPYALIGENTPLGGQFTGFGARAALNDRDELAFVAGVGRGRTRHGLFITSPTRLAPHRLAVRLSNGRARDRLALGLRLELGRVSDGVTPGSEPVTLSLSDTRGLLWSANVSAGRLKRRGGAWVLTLRRRDELRRQLRALSLRVRRDGTLDLTAAAAPVDLTERGFRTLRPPFTVTMQVGDDSGNVAVGCRLGKRGARCR